MKYLTSAAMALVLLAGATAASADATNSTDDQHHHDTTGTTTTGGHNGGQTNTGGHTTTTTGGQTNTGGHNNTGSQTSTGGPAPGAPNPTGGNPGLLRFGTNPNGQTQTPPNGGQPNTSTNPMSGNPNAAPYGSYTGSTTNGGSNNNTGGNPNHSHDRSNPNGSNANGGNFNQGGNNNYNGNQNSNNGRPPSVDRPGFGHPPRSRDVGRQLYNPNTFPEQFRVIRRFHIAPYQQPRGWYSRQWEFGDFLPFGWFSSAYYLNWGYYGLPAPPFGCEWVREGNDALLVDVWSGEVLSIYENIFW